MSECQETSTRLAHRSRQYFISKENCRPALLFSFESINWGVTTSRKIFWKVLWADICHCRYSGEYLQWSNDQVALQILMRSTRWQNTRLYRVSRTWYEKNVLAKKWYKTASTAIAYLYPVWKYDFLKGFHNNHTFKVFLIIKSQISSDQNDFFQHLGTFLESASNCLDV